MDLTDPATFARVYDEHHRGVYARARTGSSATPPRPRTSSRTCSCALWRNPRSSTRGAASSAPTCG